MLEAFGGYFQCWKFVFVGKSKYKKLAIKYGNWQSFKFGKGCYNIYSRKETSYATHKPIVNVFIANLCHVGHIG